MGKRYFILFSLLILISSSCERQIAGSYASNFSIYGLYSERLNLKEDSSFEYVSGHILEYTITGKWHFVNGHVLIAADTLRGKLRSTYFYKAGKLFDMSKKEYREFKAHIDHLADSLHLVIHLSAKANLASSNTMGAEKVYYLRRVNQ